MKGERTQETRPGPFTPGAGLRAWFRQWKSLLLATATAAGLYALVGALVWKMPVILAGPEGPNAADQHGVAEVMFVQRGTSPERPAYVGLRMNGVALVARAPEVTATLKPGARVRVTYRPALSRLAGEYTVRRIEPLEQPSTGAGSTGQR